MKKPPHLDAQCFEHALAENNKAFRFRMIAESEGFVLWKFYLVEFFSCQHLVCFFIFRDCLVNDIQIGRAHV